jgi:hypothetical protein
VVCHGGAFIQPRVNFLHQKIHCTILLHTELKRRHHAAREPGHVGPNGAVAPAHGLPNGNRGKCEGRMRMC